MSPLRRRMVEDLRIRKYSPHTIRMYVDRVARFARHYGRSPAELGPEAVHAYQLHLLDTGASWSRFKQAVSALRFLYRITLARPWPVEHHPYGKKRRSLPVVLSQDEVLRLIAAVRSPMHRVALATAYAGGLRISEVVALRPEDIDSARMLIHIADGKGHHAELHASRELRRRRVRFGGRQ